MKIKEKWYESSRLRLLGAVLLNAVLLAVILLLISPGFESNDDQTLAAFVDGQMAQKDAYMPYINFVMANILKGMYTLLGDSLAWFSIFQYLLLFASFTAISWVFFERLRAWQGVVLSLILLLFVGLNSYTVISYTKTAAICTVGGLLLMLQIMEGGYARRVLPLIIGGAISLCGAMLRFMEFLPCAALMSVIGLRRLAEIFVGDGFKSERLKAAGRYMLPFLLTLVMAGALYAVDDLAWRREPWAEYDRFDASRIALTDYGVPAYEDMPQAYEALGLNESAVELFGEGNWYAPELFSKDTVESISAARAEIAPSPSMGECLGIFLDKCLLGFFLHPHSYALLFMLLLWLACGKRKLLDFLCLGAELCLFALFYLYLIYRGRYLVIRVDIGLFAAVFLVMAWLLDKEKMSGEKNLSLLIVTAAVAVCLWINRGSFRFQRKDSDMSGWKAAVETILSDEEHLYLCKFGPLDLPIYSAFQTVPAGYWDRIVLMGGWPAKHPHIAATLAQHGITNPYRDAVGNERVYVIDDKIDVTMDFIHSYYDPDASAELLTELSEKTGLLIYRILD